MAQSEDTATNLTGVWYGEYWYGGGGDRTRFAAHLIETAGALTGTTLELYGPGAAMELSAVLSGARDGADVVFTKTYDAAQRINADPIGYSGSADAGLQVIDGQWKIRGKEPLTGGFVMRRVTATKQAAKREMAEVLNAGR